MFSKMATYQTSIEYILILISIQILLCHAKKQCVDGDSKCRSWANEGKCISSSYVKQYCPRSCNVCSASYDDYLFEDISKAADVTISLLFIFFVIMVAGLFVGFLKYYNAGGMCRSKGALKGKTVVVTGGTSGIGYETVFHLAMRGAKVIIGCRCLKQGFKTARNIQKHVGRNCVVVKKLNLESFQSVRVFAQEIIEDLERVDILINNAGIISSKTRSVTIDQNEKTFQVNYLSHFLLTKLLLKKLKESSPSRIINIVCDNFHKGQIDFSDLQLKKKFSNWDAYNNSKLGLVLFTKHLNNILKESSVTANAVHPGRSNTYLTRDVAPYNYKLAWPLIATFAYLFWKTPSHAAETTYYCSLEQELESVSGKYFSDCKETSCCSQDESVAQKLWEVTDQLVEMVVDHSTLNVDKSDDTSVRSKSESSKKED